MIEPAEDPKAGPTPDHKSKGKFDTTLYKDRLEEAVIDAQFMMDYAATNTKSIIDPVTLKRLITARQSIEDGEELTADQETEFWIAYQDLWEIVSPATAESIKANLLIQDTFTSRLVNKSTYLQDWLGKSKTSKARRTVGRYILLTIVVLFFLLLFQIYWVVGNQLITEMGTISQRQDFLNSQIAEITSNPASDASAVSQEAGLQTDLDALNYKEERYAAILWLWSKPWSGYIEVVRKEHDPKFASQFAEIEQKIAEIENKQQEDPDGSIEAQANAQQEDLQLRLKKAENKVPKDTAEITSLKRQIENLSRISELESVVLGLTAKIQEDQTKLDELNAQVTENNDLIISLTADKSTIQVNYDSLSEDLQTLAKQIDGLNNDIGNIKKITSQFGNTTPASGTAPLQAADLTALPEDLQRGLIGKSDLNDQLALLNVYQENLQLQLEYLQERQKQIENQQAQLNLDAINLQAEIDDLSEKVINWNAEIADLDASLEKNKAAKKTNEDAITTLEKYVGEFQGLLTAEAKQAIVDKRVADLNVLKLKQDNLSLEEQEYLDRTDSRPAQLAGQFVLNILQSYFLPILYGLLGASTSVLRSLSRQIKDVTFSEKTGIQHLLSISLGALAGIVVGWFSFLIDAGNSFLGSVSPLAIAFLVGYNIDPFFSRMDLIMKSGEQTPPATTSAAKMDAKLAASQVASRLETEKPSSSTEVAPARAAVPRNEIDKQI